MKRTALVITILLSMLSVCHADEATYQIAKVDMRELESLLQDIAFARPANQEVYDRYQESQAWEKKMMSGEFDREKAARSFRPDLMNVKDEVRNLVRGELIVIIEAVFDDQYDLVVDDSFGDGIVYTKLAIPDITQNLKQHLLKRRIEQQESEEVEEPKD